MSLSVVTTPEDLATIGIVFTIWSDSDHTGSGKVIQAPELFPDRLSTPVDVVERKNR